MNERLKKYTRRDILSAGLGVAALMSGTAGIVSISKLVSFQDMIDSHIKSGICDHVFTTRDELDKCEKERVKVRTEIMTKDMENEERKNLVTGIVGYTVSAIAMLKLAMEMDGKNKTNV